MNKPGLKGQFEEKCMIGISLMENSVMEYGWGSQREMQEFMGMPDKIGRPMAELWMGAHPKDPSKVMVDGQWRSLERVISENSEAALGSAVSESFGAKLPFLFKLLAIESPLSIQVHPDMSRAERGYLRENSAGIPLGAPERNYKDENHKPEVICALTDFCGLIGFREIKEIVELFEEAFPSVLDAELAMLRDLKDPKGLEKFFTSLMKMKGKSKTRILSMAGEIAENRGGTDPAFYRVKQLCEKFPGDTAALFPLMLNVVDLKPGDAVYIAPGELHAYLNGMGIELMSNSDNVLRGGLTNKHVDVEELLKIVDFREQPVNRISPSVIGKGEIQYSTPAKEFLLSILTIKEKGIFKSRPNQGPEILLCAGGTANIRDTKNGVSLFLKKGQSAFVPASVSKYELEGATIFFRASVPI